ncbi:MAG: Bicarbonate transport ATP-binding protein CmpC [Syntrophomonadaceae bacterium]|nr:Bicarbonate transport ATP-binding protein CmpC [Bacillota bacterium]
MLMNNKNLRLLLPVVAAVALAVVVTGYGRRTETPAPAVPVSQDKPLLKIGYLPITHATALVMAHQERGGAFANFDMEVVKFGSWPELTEALFAGHIDGAVMLFELALAGRQRGIPLQAVALGHRDGNVMVARPEIAAVADLSGRRVAIPSRFSVHHILLYKALQNAGLSLADVEIVEMAPPDMMAALAGGEIAAYLVAEPFGAVAEVQGVGKILLPSQEIWENSTCCVLALREEVLRDHPEAATELTIALLAAGEAAEADPQKAVAVSRQYFGHAEDILLPGLARTTFRELAPTVQEFAEHQQYLLDLGVLTEPVALEELINEELAKER